eukprot:Em0006g468a
MTPLEVLTFAASFSAVRTADLILRQPQSVASAINGTAEFNCSISSGNLQWEVKLNGGGTSLYWPFHIAALMARDVNASYFSQQQSSLFIKATYQNNSTSVRCVSDVQPLAQSAVAVLTVYNRPTPPTRLGASVAGNLSLNISWIPPFSLPGVSTSYSIWLDGNATAFVVDLSYYAYRYTGTSPCQSHRITVVAGNAAGDSDTSEPLVTDMPQVGQFVTTPNSTVELNGASHVTIRDAQILGPYVPTNNISNVIDASDGLQPDTKYVYTITAVNVAGNSSTLAQAVYTTDVQSATITGSDHQLNVTCFFAVGTLAKGCVVYLKKSGKVVYQMIPRVNGTAKGVIRTEFSVDCYNISVMDWEEDGSIGSLGVPVSGVAPTSCLDTSATSSFEELIYIVTGVAIAVGIIVMATMLVAIGVCCRMHLTTKQAELARQDIQRSTSGYQDGHNATANSFASDPVYTSSILYVGEIATTPFGTSKLINKVTAGDNLSQQWAARLAPPTSTGLDYNKLDRQFSQFQSPSGAKRFSSSSVSSHPLPVSSHPLPVSSPHLHHHTPGHPLTPVAVGSPSVPAPPTQRKLSSAQAKVHEYELPFEQLGGREGRVRENMSTAFTDV